MHLCQSVKCNNALVHSMSHPKLTPIEWMVVPLHSRLHSEISDQLHNGSATMQYIYSIIGWPFVAAIHEYDCSIRQVLGYPATVLPLS